jgi:hypothetical protein
MLDRTITPIGASDIQALSDDAWNEFTATSPQGIDFVAEASVRRLMASRIRSAVTRGERDRGALREGALQGL